jgi:hypothetical protein
MNISEKYSEELTATEFAITLEDHYGAHNYHPMPVVLSVVKVFLFGM